MGDQIIHEYHGEKISFDESKEEWKVVFDGKAQYHKSLQVIKNYIDRRNKKKFDRIPVFIQKGRYYGENEGYVKATITSVGVDGTIFIVREGRKSAEHCGMAYVRNAKNEKLIEEITTLHKAKEQATERLRVARNRLVVVNFETLRKKALGGQK